MVKHKFGGNVFSKDSQKMENNAKVFETIKLNKKLMLKIQLEHSSWDSCTKVYLMISK
jgi:uncharacterized protein YpiB (UPF0302 family)